MRRIADRLRRGFHLHTPQVSDNLPYFFICHAHALSIGSIRRHSRAGNTGADVVEHVGIRVSMTLVGARKVRAASSSTRTQPMAKRAINAELERSCLGRRRISGQWVALLCPQEGTGECGEAKPQT